jgi:hypothetical protein
MGGEGEDGFREEVCRGVSDLRRSEADIAEEKR